MKFYSKIKEIILSIDHYKRNINWNIISAIKMPKIFLDLLKDYLNWDIVSIYQKLDELTIIQYKDKINFKFISKFQKNLSEEFISEYLTRLYLPYLLMYQKNISLEFLNSHKENFSSNDWAIISKFRELDINFILENANQLNFSLISKYQSFSYTDYLLISNKIVPKYLIHNTKLKENNFFTENFFINHLEGIIPFNWALENIKFSIPYLESKKCFITTKRLCKYQTLTEEFIEKYRYWLNWFMICKYQTLSEEFMDKYFEFLNKKNICKYQTLSEEFMDKYADSLDFNLIAKYQKGLSYDFIKMHLTKFNPTLLLIYQKNVLLDNELDEQSIFDILPFKKEFYYKIISKYQILPYKYYTNYSTLLDWDFISRYQTLNLNLLLEFKEKLNWVLVCRFQILNEETIKHPQLLSYLNFDNIAIYQNLSQSLELEQWVINNLDTYFKNSKELLYYYQLNFQESNRLRIYQSFF